MVGVAGSEPAHNIYKVPALTTSEPHCRTLVRAGGVFARSFDITLPASVQKWCLCQVTGFVN